MNKILKKIYRTFFKRIYKEVFLLLHRVGNKKKCYICGSHFRSFLKYRGGSKNIPLWIKKIVAVGSDADNFGCPFCFSNDRERHLFMYFDKLQLWNDLKDAYILHFAPEPMLPNRIETCLPKKYIKCDLLPYDDSIEKIDATNISFKDAYFDFIIFNHVLEHIPDYQKALKELFRVLKPNGSVVIQTPFSKLFNKHFEDTAIDNDDLRTFFYGKEDHVRVFSEKQLFNDYKSAGFIVKINKHDSFFNDEDTRYYGVNKLEDLIIITKPSD